MDGQSHAMKIISDMNAFLLDSRFCPADFVDSVPAQPEPNRQLKVGYTR